MALTLAECLTLTFRMTPAVIKNIINREMPVLSDGREAPVEGSRVWEGAKRLANSSQGVGPSRVQDIYINLSLHVLG